MQKTIEKQLAALVEMATLIGSSMDPLEITERATASAMELVNAEAGSLMLLDEKRWELFFQVALGEKGALIKDIRLKKGEGIAGWVVENRVPVLVNDVQRDPRFNRTVDRISRFQTLAMLCVPLITPKGRVLGVLQAINKHRGKFSEEDLAMLRTLAAPVAVALENAFLYEQNSRQMQAIISQERQHRQEKEKLIRDLHDGIGGLAANVSILAEVGRRADSRADMDSCLATIADLSREAVAEIRAFMNTVEEGTLTWQALAGELRHFGSTLLAPHGINCHCSADIAGRQPSPGLFFYQSVCRIAREALTNVVKHAAAGNVAIGLSVRRRRLSLTIADDGRGVSGAEPPGRGLANMRKRAEELGGSYTIIVAGGTTISIDIPLPGKSATPSTTSRRLPWRPVQ
ncbi:MAG: hamp domain/gaf domain/hd domain [Geobacteraceae bacterium]|nr:MAG: hamp domain/gaf domain/hd domain [Geobacteraceae bacterium]